MCILLGNGQCLTHYPLALRPVPPPHPLPRLPLVEPAVDAFSYLSFAPKLSCPRGVGQWRGDWSRDSGMWGAYPSIKTELRRLRQQRAGSAAPPPAADKDGEGGGGAGAWGAVTEATAVGPGGGEREPEEDEQEEGSSFWMTFDDFTTEFSQARNGVSAPSKPRKHSLSPFNLKKDHTPFLGCRQITLVKRVIETSCSCDSPRFTTLRQIIFIRGIGFRGESYPRSHREYSCQ